MSKLRTSKWRRMFCGVPRDNHETYLTDEGTWECRSCLFIGLQEEGTAHVIAAQFVPVQDIER